MAKSPQWVELKLIQKTRCQGCTGQCHRPLFKLFSIQDDRFRIHHHQPGLQLNNSHLLFAEDSSGRGVGQQVGLEIDDHEILSGGFYFYVWPLLIIIVAMSLGHYLAVLNQQAPDLWAFMGFLLALLWVFFRYRLRRLTVKTTLPKVTII